MLTEEQKRARAGKLTASRVSVLMTGDVDGIMRLYHELRDEAEPEDLSMNWAVRLGEATEALNLEWVERKGLKLAGQGCFIQSSKLPFAGATLDAWCEELRCPVEVKHVGGHEPLQIVIDRYQPQLQWQMYCTEAEQCALSVIMGANEPVLRYVERDQSYIDIMIERAIQFMGFVERGEPPVDLPAVPAPADAKKIYDMTGNNEWANHAGVWRETREPAKLNADTALILKNMVPADAKKCIGHGIYISRDLVGRLSLREEKQQ